MIQVKARQEQYDGDVDRRLDEVVGGRQQEYPESSQVGRQADKQASKRYAGLTLLIKRNEVGSLG